jgi:hypothetical protein
MQINYPYSLLSIEMNQIKPLYQGQLTITLQAYVPGSKHGIQFTTQALRIFISARLSGSQE